jgi:hypothetical protein
MPPHITLEFSKLKSGVATQALSVATPLKSYNRPNANSLVKYRDSLFRKATGIESEVPSPCCFIKNKDAVKRFKAECSIPYFYLYDFGF